MFEIGVYTSEETTEPTYTFGHFKTEYEAWEWIDKNGDPRYSYTVIPV